MCGIVGILGRGPVADQIVDSLKRLEYRGYDSAGVATLEGDRLERRRAQGKLKKLETRLTAQPTRAAGRGKKKNFGGAWRGGAARRPYRHRAHALGHPRQADREQRPSA